VKTIKTLIALAFTTGLASAQVERREIRLTDCPAAIQTTVEAHARGGAVEEVDLIAIDGKQIYIAEVDLPRDRDLKIYVSGNGALVKTREDILLSDAPEPVRSAALALDGSVDDVDKEVTGNTVTYHVEVDRHGMADLDVVLAADGKVLSQTEEAGD
jgi:uncharacterized membrane protein YkoI